MTAGSASTSAGSGNPDMRGKVVRIAGASGGIGSASAAGIAKLGAITVVVVGCDPNRAEVAAAQVLEDTGSIAEGA